MTSASQKARFPVAIVGGMLAASISLGMISGCSCADIPVLKTAEVLVMQEEMAFQPSAGDAESPITETDSPVDDSEGKNHQASAATNLPTGTTLSFEDVAARGEDAFFTVSEISDDVFTRMQGRSFKAGCTVPRESLRYVRVLHVDAEGTIKVGELVVADSIAGDVCDIFRELYHAGYPIEKMRLVDDYGADDNASMEDNNTSAFNYRVVAGTDCLSRHAYGLAIDINPFYNPYVIPSEGYVSPASAAAYADRDVDNPYKIVRGDLCYRLFTEHGFAWGGDWGSPKDYQHFEK